MGLDQSQGVGQAADPLLVSIRGRPEKQMYMLSVFWVSFVSAYDSPGCFPGNREIDFNTA